MSRRFLTRAALAVCALPLVASLSAAQDSFAPRRSWLEATAGTELEEYLRALSIDTTVMRPGGTFTTRPIGIEELVRQLKPAARHPWRDEFEVPNGNVGRGSRARVLVLRPTAAEIWNSAFPFDINEGAVWAGRGLTTVATGGLYVFAGPFHLRLEPLVFRAENNAFPLADNGFSDDRRFRDPTAPNAIDQPQRFGTRALQRIDLGESDLGVRAWYVAAGVSNAREEWGPAVTHPVILGANAPGFPHAYIATARPLPIGIGRVSGRSIVGRLYQTQWSPAPDSLSKRLVAAMVVAFQPRGVSGLELGGIRFFHRRLIGSVPSLRDFFIPVDGLLFKRGNTQVDDPESQRYTPDNQVASAFVRWAPTGARFEAYAEYGRNDAAYDVRELAIEPDHASAYTIGVRRLLGEGTRRTLVRFEWLNGRTTSIQRVRPQAKFYDHNILLQGHTNRGKVLGSVAMMGGGGVNIGIDRYDARGKTSFDFHRIDRLSPYGEGVETPKQLDVQHVFAVERTRFHDRYDSAFGAAAIWELNRDFTHDALGLRLNASVKLGGRSVSASAR